MQPGSDKQRHIVVRMQPGSLGVPEVHSLPGLAVTQKSKGSPGAHPVAPKARLGVTRAKRGCELEVTGRAEGTKGHGRCEKRGHRARRRRAKSPARSAGHGGCENP